AKLVELGEAAADLRVAVLRYLATGEANQRNAMQAAIALGHTALRPLLSAPASPSFRDQVLALQQAFTELGATASQLAGFTTQMAAHQRDGAAPARAAAERLLGALVETYTAVQKEAQAVSAAESAAVRRDLLMLSIAIGLTLVVSGGATAVAIATPLRRLTQTLDRIAGGDTAVEVGFSGRRDEIGRIAAATERLRSEAERAFLQSQILDQLPQPVMVADPRNDFRITYMNRATRETLASVEQLLPAKVDALLGQSID
ncbi:MAG: HAMP domain-containing protein, partial [Elioraea sp.]|nr:HAMP domain-containing protein [Elioraea sp.]